MSSVLSRSNMSTSSLCSSTAPRSSQIRRRGLRFSRGGVGSALTTRKSFLASGVKRPTQPILVRAKSITEGGMACCAEDARQRRRKWCATSAAALNQQLLFRPLRNFRPALGTHQNLPVATTALVQNVWSPPSVRHAPRRKQQRIGSICSLGNAALVSLTAVAWTIVSGRQIYIVHRLVLILWPNG